MVSHVGIGAALAAFAAGLVSFFSPCVAPLVPGYIGYLSGASLETPEGISAAPAARTGISRTLPVCLLFVGGFSAAFVGLGLASASFGRLLSAYQPVLETIAGIVMLIMGAFLLDLLPKQLTQVLLREGRLQLKVGRGGWIGAGAPFALGIIFAAGWTPCIGPVLASILVYVSASADWVSGTTLLAFYSLGFAVPFLAIGLGWTRSLQALGWIRKHGQRVSQVSGVVLILVGLVYLSGQVSVFAQWAQPFSVPAFH